MSVHKGKKIICVVPARLHSSRLPYKVLKTLGGKPLLQRVFEAASKCALFDEIVFAVDAEQTKTLVESFGARALMTSQTCPNGTMRMIEAKDLYGIQGDVWVNWQADEPFITKSLILDLLQSIHDMCSDIWTLRSVIHERAELEDPNVVKVVTGLGDRALYFSRFPIPYSRDNAPCTWYKHIGIYAFTTKALETIATLPSCELERIESLEQLRFLYHGMQVIAHTTSCKTLGIDLQEHLDLAETLVQSDLLTM